eukprot:jgi/Mesvir1/28956/Mv17733-RA.1
MHWRGVHDAVRFVIHFGLGGLDLVRNGAAHALGKSCVPDLNERDFKGRVAIVTGANAGVGRATASLLAERHCHVVMACRSPERGAAAARQVLEEHPTSHVDVMPLDLLSFASVRNFASQFRRRGLTCDYLVNNAGIMGKPFSLSEDGFESHFQSNYLGHFLLTHLLRPCMSTGCRIICLSSVKMWPRIDFDSFDDAAFATGAGAGGRGGLLRTPLVGPRRKFSAYRCYQQSKRAQELFVLELTRRALLSASRKAASSSNNRVSCDAGKSMSVTSSSGAYGGSSSTSMDANMMGMDVVPVAVHPGLVQTDLADTGFFRKYFGSLFARVVPLRSCEDAARQVLFALTAPARQVAGKYVMDGKAHDISSFDDDGKTAGRLWDTSLDLCHVNDAFPVR